MRMRTHPIAALLGLCLSAAGCEPAQTESVAESRDSAGIRIVENEGPAWTAEERWRISDEPILEIGSVAGPAEYQFGYAHGPVRLSDGRIVVADMQASRMNFYDPEGRFLMSAGRSGGGPGEFGQLYRLRKISGDSLMAVDPPSLTSIFSPSGEFVRRFSLETVPSRSNIWWIGRLEGAALVAMSLQREGTRTVSPPADAAEGEEYPRFVCPERHEFYRDTLLHFLFTTEGELIDSVVKLPGQYLAANRTFAPNAAYAFHEDAFLHSPGNIAEIRRFRLERDESGEPRSLRLDQIVRRPPLRDLRVTDEIKEAYFESERERYRELAEQYPGRFDAASVERRLREMNFPELLPDHGNRMWADALGNLWLQDYRIDDTGPFRWSVFTPEGRWLGVVETPANFTVNEIGSDYVLGVARDELDVSYVRMYRLLKPGGTRE